MKAKKAKIDKSWVVYILRCIDNSLYTGITNNIEKRLAAHNQGPAAKYTRSRRPVVLSAQSRSLCRTEAMCLEIKIKRMPKEKKIAAINKIRKEKKVK